MGLPSLVPRFRQDSGARDAETGAGCELHDAASEGADAGSPDACPVGGCVVRARNMGCVSWACSRSVASSVAVPALMEEMNKLSMWF